MNHETASGFPSLKGNHLNAWMLSPENYGELLVWFLDMAIENPQFEIMNVNDFCRCVFTSVGTVCSYADAWGQPLR